MTKKNLIVMVFLTICILLSGCKKEAAEPDVANNQRKAPPVSSPGSQNLSNVQPRCENTIILYAGQFFNIGSLYYVNNSSGTIDFTYSTKAPWKITHISLYMGDCASIPMNKPGNTMPGLYPYQKTIDGGADSISIQVPQDEVPNCGCIAAHAKVYNTSTGATESAWAEGTRFVFKNWAMYSPYCLTSCDPAIQGCCYPLAYWYLEVNSSKLPEGIPIGSYNYSPEEIYTLWQKTDPDNLSDSRFCVIQVAAVKLSSGQIATGADIWADVSTCENYLNSFSQKISPSYMPTGNTQARNAANKINDWIRQHACNN